MKSAINKSLERIGYRIINIRNIPQKKHFIRRNKLLDYYNIDTILDVGANIGQYGKQLRKKVNYKGKIISFEPMAKEFELLSKFSEADPLWDVANFALGNENGESEIQISGNSVSSSLLDMLPSVVEVCSDEASYIGKEIITIKTLDSIFNEYCLPTNNVFLKIDTQGYERTVLEGALNSLPSIAGIQLEMSFIPFYKDEILFDEMIEYVSSQGFSLMSIEPVLENADTGRQLQVDGLFFRE